MTDLSRTIAVKPIIKYPREAQVGKTYLMTIDLQLEEGFEWRYEEEDYPVYCSVDSDLFSSRPVGEPVVVLHRFGGSYGAAQFLLKAMYEEAGEIALVLINKWGIPIKLIQLNSAAKKIDNQVDVSANLEGTELQEGNEILEINDLRESERLNFERGCPYMGLFSFKVSDAPFFFGREAYVEQLVKTLQHKAIAAVVGPSGSGKSSVVFAGLIPSLIKQGTWLIGDFRPKSDPFFALAVTSIRLLEPEIKESEQLIHAVRLKQEFQAGRLSVQQVVERILEKNAGKKLLLVIDQFEELYTLCAEEATRYSFIDTLIAAFSENERSQNRGVNDGSPRLVLTMRADFLGNALSYRPLADVLQSNMILLSSMNQQELRQIIEQPARMLGVKLEAGLTERILSDIKSEPGSLPLLEFILTLLWERRIDGFLTHQGYHEIGGIATGMAMYAEQVYSRLAPADQNQARQVFLQLVRAGEGTEDTQRLATRSEIRDYWPVVILLANERLVVTRSNKEFGEETVEIVHEALIREWQRLRNWIEEERAWLRLKYRIESAATDWVQRNKSKAYLLQGGLLKEAEVWLTEYPNDIYLSSLAEEFIQKSLSNQNLFQRFLRLWR